MLEAGERVVWAALRKIPNMRALSVSSLPHMPHVRLVFQWACQTRASLPVLSCALVVL